MSDSPPQSAFVDTNVLVYAATASGAKSTAAQELIRELVLHKALRTSTQVFQEFYVTVTRKIEVALSSEQAIRFLDAWSVCPVFTLDYPAIREAAKLAGTVRISFWDSLILVAAARSGATHVYTEDLQHGQTIGGVKIVNPFRPTA
jgi:predicted nucleic acid-binding protein